jgi:hypothetical protein
VTTKLTVVAVLPLKFKVPNVSTRRLDHFECVIHDSQGSSAKSCLSLMKLRAKSLWWPPGIQALAMVDTLLQLKE